MPAWSRAALRLAARPPRRRICGESSTPWRPAPNPRLPPRLRGPRCNSAPCTPCGTPPRTPPGNPRRSRRPEGPRGFRSPARHGAYRRTAERRAGAWRACGRGLPPAAPQAPRRLRRCLPAPPRRDAPASSRKCPAGFPQRACRRRSRRPRPSAPRPGQHRARARSWPHAAVPRLRKPRAHICAGRGPARRKRRATHAPCSRWRPGECPRRPPRRTIPAAGRHVRGSPPPPRLRRGPSRRR